MQIECGTERVSEQPFHRSNGFLSVVHIKGGLIARRDDYIAHRITCFLHFIVLARLLHSF